MLNQDFAKLFERDILKLKTEISAYTDESKLWIITEGISNSAGNLCLHLLGNLQHYIGGNLGKSGYVRNRPEEFSQKDIPIANLIETIEQVAVLIKQTIQSLSDETLASDYPEKVFDHNMTTQYFLLHLLAHLDYHLGQINYHRRIVG